MNKPRILAVDDEDIICELLKRTLQSAGYAVDIVRDGTSAIEMIKRSFYNLIICDLRMPQVNGIEILKKIKKINPYIEVIIITGYATIESAVEAIKIGAFDFICKPFDIEELQLIITRCLEKQLIMFNNVELNELNTLFEISRITAVRADLNSLLKSILQSAMKLAKANHGYLVLFDEETGQINMSVGEGVGVQQLDVSQIKSEADVLGAGREGPMGYESFSSISVPLQRGESKVFGVLSVSDQREAGEFNLREKTLLGVVAGQASAAIENCRLYTQLQDKIKTLQGAIDELHATQNQLIQSEKMSAVGQLAFGIAHEIRNPLGIVLGGVDFIRTKVSSGDMVMEESMAKMKQAIERANDIIISLLKFSRSSQLKLQAVNIKVALEEVVRLVNNQACISRVKIATDFVGGDYYIQADPVLLRQAFFNLCVNAFDAMPQGGELKLVLSVAGNEDTRGGDALIEVVDSGVGVSTETISKIFDPFYTTKEPGKGTGLGLSIVHLIIQRHGGTIQVQSTVGVGTRFIIRLPLEWADVAKNTGGEADAIKPKEEDPAHR